ncbi:MAG: hypothetical protein RR696_15255, partial [Clostridia bacterium]
IFVKARTVQISHNIQQLRAFRLLWDCPQSFLVFFYFLVVFFHSQFYNNTADWLMKYSQALSISRKEVIKRGT